MHIAQLSLASVKSRLVLPFWYRLTWVVPDKGPLNVCVCVCVCVCACACARARARARVRVRVCVCVLFRTFAVTVHQFIYLFLAFRHFPNSFNIEITNNQTIAHCEIVTTTSIKASPCPIQNNGPISDSWQGPTQQSDCQ